MTRVTHTHGVAFCGFCVGSTRPSPRGGIPFVLCPSWLPRERYARTAAGDGAFFFSEDDTVESAYGTVTDGFSSFSTVFDLGLRFGLVFPYHFLFLLPSSCSFPSLYWSIHLQQQRLVIRRHGSSVIVLASGLQ